MRLCACYGANVAQEFLFGVGVLSGVIVCVCVVVVQGSLSGLNVFVVRSSIY